MGMPHGEMQMWALPSFEHKLSHYACMPLTSTWSPWTFVKTIESGGKMKIVLMN